MTISCRIVLLAAAVLLAPAAGAQDLTATVTRVIDGDSLRIETRSGQSLELRLAGIDAPELSQGYGRTAQRALALLVQGQELAITLKGTDRYGRLLGCPALAGENLCLRLVRDGHAWVYRQWNRDAQHLAAQKLAQEAGRGLWHENPAPVPPWTYRARQAAADNPEGCRIKGNISQSGQRIYHQPGQQHYDRTRISPGKGERWFCSEAQARQAGWRPARG